MMSSGDEGPSNADVTLNSSVADLNLQEPQTSSSPDNAADSATISYQPPISNNVPGFRYKYPQAKPTPPGVDDTEWNKLFTAADSRYYNKHGKNSKESEKYRIRGETYELALKMLGEKREKEKLVAAGLLPAKARKIPTADKLGKMSTTIKREPSTASRDATPMFGTSIGDMTLGIAEKIKSEGRARKPMAPTTISSDRGTPAPTTTIKSTPIPPPKLDKPVLKKKATAPSVKKPVIKPRSETPSGTSGSRPSGPRTSNSTDNESGSNDGGEYCICRGPDDHRMMVCCEGGCDDWYHCSCVGIDETDTRELLDRYVCPKCTTAEAFTTWKPMCRYYNVGIFQGKLPCKKHARVTMNPPSKYCSDEHRDAFWTFVKSRVRGDEKPSMGGALNRKEIGWLLERSKTADDVHGLGGKPRLPNKEDADLTRPVGLYYLTAEEQLEIAEIQQKKAVIEARVGGFTNQVKVLVMINDRAKHALKLTNLEVKDFCGYDNRLAMNEAEFSIWCNTAEGQAALETGEIGPRTSETLSLGMIMPHPAQSIPDAPKGPDALNNMCLKARKKCKHLNWRELHNHDFVYNKKILRDELERLARAEAEIVDNAETREAAKDYYANNVTIQLF